MQSLRNAILGYMRIEVRQEGGFLRRPLNGRYKHEQQSFICSKATIANHGEVIDKVMNLVRNFDKINTDKVTDTADFQKDLSLDSLDRVELVMAFEEEFSVEIPDAEADKLKCCADVANYIISNSRDKVSENS